MKSFLSHQSRIRKKLSRSSAGLLFLDYDGTLSPIVKNPDKAVMPLNIRRELKRVLNNPAWHVVVISGRRLSFIKKQVRFQSVTFVGNHGYEIKRPRQPVQVHKAAQQSKILLRKIFQQFKTALKSRKGIRLENKVWSLTIHTRNASKENEQYAERVFKKVTASYLKKKKIKCTTGKKVLEVRPPARWNKGEAIKFLWKERRKKGEKTYPVFIGDDVTDEDGFKALRKNGLTIRVGRNKKSAALYHIANIKSMPKVLRFINSVFNL